MYTAIVTEEKMKKFLAILITVSLSLTVLFASGSSESGVDNSLADVQEKGTFILFPANGFPF